MRLNLGIHYVLFGFVNIVSSAKILGWFPCPALSQQSVYQPIWKELSLRGHEVTVITPNPLKDSSLKNLTEIDVSFSYKLWDDYDISEMRRETVTAFFMEYSFQEAITRSLTMQVEESKEVQKILNEKPSNYYDLIIIESLHPITYGIQHKFKAPLIAVSPLSSYNYLNFLMGNPIHFYPDFVAELTTPSSFTERIDSLFLNIGGYLLNKFVIYPNSDRVARKFFGNDMPYIEEMVKKTSILMMNVDPIFSDKRPLAPNVFEFTGMHNKRKEVMDKDLKKILDESKNGVVYFSLGTNVRFGHLESNFKQTMLEALGELPYTVLCKWESEDFPNKPKNVVLRKFFPQQSILSHPNIKLFVTQGGLQSSEEAISNGVPLVVIPFLGDQPMNARILSGHGMAETILPKDLSKEILRDTILKVAKDEKYRLRAQELRSIFLDQPESGVDKIIWWCEYVIRHKGAKHLRSPSADIPLYEYFMLDVFAVIFAFLFIGYKVFRFVVCKFISFCKGTEKSKTKQKTN